VRRLARAEQPRMGIEVIIKHHRAHNPCIDDSAGGAGPAAVGICIGGGGKRDPVVFVMS